VGDTSKPGDAGDAEIAWLEVTVARIRVLNERLIESTTSQGARWLDAYERALTNLVQVTESFGATQLDWLAALAQAHADFIQDAGTVYTATVRALLD
jgi:hypothetical protein